MIIPAILESSIAEVQAKINRVKGLVGRVQINIISLLSVLMVTSIQNL